MKLFTRYSRINVLANIAVFLVASLAFYFSLRYVLIKVVDEDLEIEEDEITAFVKEHNRLPESFSVSDQIITFTQSAQPAKRTVITIERRDVEDNKEEKFRQLVFSINAAGQTYTANVAKSLEGTDNLLRSILLVSISTILAILFVSFLLNRLLLKKLWKPFYQSLDAVKKFSVSKDQPLQLSPTNIDEFSLMNQTLEGFTKASRLEYVSLKTFSENASHEIQTPLAVIRSKLDLLIQDESLTESQGETLQSTYNALEKLSRLNQSLLLLAKIENNQFQEMQAVNLQKKLQEKCEEFKELWQSQIISVETAWEKTTVKMNEELADILLNNLLSNATKHNCNGGKILISLSQDALSVKNTSPYSALDTQNMFQRFSSQVGNGSRHGLGLSIIKEICEASDFAISYAHEQGIHSFVIHFPETSSTVH